MNLRIPEQNKVLLVGRLTRDPDLRFTPNGRPVCRLDLAVNRHYKNSSGEWQEETAFVPVVVWQEMAKRCAQALKKARPVSVEGRLSTRKWVTKEGENRSVLEVIAQGVQFLSKDDLSSVDLRPEPAESVGEPVSEAIPTGVDPVRNGVSRRDISNGVEEKKPLDSEEVPF